MSDGDETRDELELRLARREMAGEDPGSVGALLRTAVDTALRELGQQPLASTVTVRGLARLPLRIVAAFRDRDRARRRELETLAELWEERAKYVGDFRPAFEPSPEDWARAAAQRETLLDAARELRALVTK